jgi:hypothetical protein
MESKYHKKMSNQQLSRSNIAHSGLRDTKKESRQAANVSISKYPPRGHCITANLGHVATVELLLDAVDREVGRNAEKLQKHLLGHLVDADCGR